VRTGGGSEVKVQWSTAYAAGEPLSRYEIYRRDEKIGTVPFAPQLTEELFSFSDPAAPASHAGGVYYKIRAIDAAGKFDDSMSVRPG
jgi:hypothetical protein